MEKNHEPWSNSAGLSSLASSFARRRAGEQALRKLDQRNAFLTHSKKSAVHYRVEYFNASLKLKGLSETVSTYFWRPLDAIRRSETLLKEQVKKKLSHNCQISKNHLLFRQRLRSKGCKGGSRGCRPPGGPDVIATPYSSGK